MRPNANPRSQAVPPALANAAPGVLNLEILQTDLAPLAHLPLVFQYDGETIRAGYHVTEIKSGSFASLDCGANPERWRETTIQLWDIEGEGATHMPVAKFLAILDKVKGEIDFDPEARVTFEVSDGASAIRLYRAAAVDTIDGAASVSLVPLPATCKPRLGWFAVSAFDGYGKCCGPAKGSDGCCA